MFFGGYDDFLAYEQGGSYGRFREKSAAAERREKEAKAIFKTALRETDFQGQAKILLTGLIPPNVHLTSACWSSFSKYVRQHSGCSGRRRKATPQEKFYYK
mmetsp:Transcript_10526/g.28639  ORF Transcript_10526/g.28639 Transcript_10526/m.28639 type:complete len:101 (+) Transcript_10526:104-406(+)